MSENNWMKQSICRNRRRITFFVSTCLLKGPSRRPVLDGSVALGLFIGEVTKSSSIGEVHVTQPPVNCSGPCKSFQEWCGCENNKVFIDFWNRISCSGQNN